MSLTALRNKKYFYVTFLFSHVSCQSSHSTTPSTSDFYHPSIYLPPISMVPTTSLIQRLEACSSVKGDWLWYSIWLPQPRPKVQIQILGDTGTGYCLTESSSPMKTVTAMAMEVVKAHQWLWAVLQWQEQIWASPLSGEDVKVLGGGEVWLGAGLARADWNQQTRLGNIKGCSWVDVWERLCLTGDDNFKRYSMAHLGGCVLFFLIFYISKWE